MLGKTLREFTEALPGVHAAITPITAMEQERTDLKRLKSLRKARTFKEFLLLGFDEKFLDDLQPGWNCLVGERRLPNRVAAKLLGVTSLRYAIIKKWFIRATSSGKPDEFTDHFSGKQGKYSLTQKFKKHIDHHVLMEAVSSITLR